MRLTNRDHRQWLAVRRAALLFTLALLLPACLPSGAIELVVKNPGFEELDGATPLYWQQDAASADKGQIAVAPEQATDGNWSLVLSPNGNNRDSEKSSTPLGLGQGFSGEAAAGKTVFLSANMAAAGGARAVLALYAHRDDGKVFGERLVSDSATMQRYSGQLTIPDDGHTRFLVLLCAVEGQSGTAWFDEVALTDQLDSSASTSGLSGTVGEPGRASISVDATSILRQIPRTLYGNNLEWVWDGNGLWNAERGELDPDGVRLTRDLDVSLLRFPGGIFADFYDWRSGVGPIDQRPATPHMPGASESVHRFGSREALDLAAATDAGLLVTANIATGEPRDAAAWLRWFRQQPDGARARYWQLGNENYNSGDADYLRQSTLSPQEYAARYSRFARALRKVDSSIAVGAISDVHLYGNAPQAYDDWTSVVLAETSEAIDFVSVHNAYAPVLAQDKGEDLRTVYAAMLAAPVLVKSSLRRLDSYIDRAYQEGETRPFIAVTEWGPAFHISPQNRFVDHVKTLGSALYVASVMKVFIETPSVEIANFFKLADPLWTGLIGRREGQFAPTAPYYALQMFSRHFGRQLVASEVRSPIFSSSQVGWVDAVPSAPVIEALASLDATGDTLYLMVINKHFDSAIPAEIDLGGFDPAGDMSILTLQGTGIDAHTGTDVFRAPGISWGKQESDASNPRFHQGGPREVALQRDSAAAPGSKFTRQFPPHSVTLLTFNRKH